LKITDTIKFKGKNLNRINIILLLSIMSLNSIAQNEKDSSSSEVYFGFKTLYGYVWSHHKFMEHLTERHFSAYEFNLGKQTNGNEDWQRIYNYPEYGLSFWYSNLGNSQYLGNAYGVFPYIKLPYINNKKLDFGFRLGCGLGYLSKHFERLENYKNNAIGSHINVLIDIKLNLNYKVYKNLFLSCGIGITHFSNGAVKMPNRGINIPSINLGLNYYLHEKQFLKPETAIQNKSKNEFKIIGNWGIKEIYQSFGNKYMAYSLSGNCFRNFSTKRKLGIGLDIFYDTSNKKRLEEEGTIISNDFEIIKPGINIGHEWEISKLTIVFQIGSYLYTKDKNDGYIYDRLALQYDLKEHLFINVSLKTHFAKADFVEWGIGYKLKKN